MRDYETERRELSAKATAKLKVTLERARIALGDQEIPEGVDPERVIYIKRVFVEPPEREDEQLAAPQELSRDEGVSQRQERRQKRRDMT